MEPNKLEKHIKKVLQEREIQPSERAWAKVSQKLDGIEPKSEKNSYLWYGVAASFIGLLVLSVFFFNSEDLLRDSDIKIVESPKQTKEVLVDEKNFEKDKVNDTVVNTSTDQNKEVEEKLFETNVAPEVKENIAIVESENIIEKKNIKKSLIVEKLALIAHSDPKIINQVDNKSATEELIEAKVLEIIANVDLYNKDNFDILSLEVDSLLRNSQEELRAQRTLNKEEWVDATSLLVEIEDELDPTFRARILEILENKIMEASLGH